MFSTKSGEYIPRIVGQFMGKISKSDTLTMNETQNLVHQPSYRLLTPPGQATPSSKGIGGWERAIFALKILCMHKN